MWVGKSIFTRNVQPAVAPIGLGTYFRTAVPPARAEGGGLFLTGQKGDGKSRTNRH